MKEEQEEEEEEQEEEKGEEETDAGSGDGSWVVVVGSAHVAVEAAVVGVVFVEVADADVGSDDDVNNGRNF